MGNPIKTIGLFDVTIALHPEVRVTVKANVARSPDEAEQQAQGVDVLAAMFEEEAAPVGFTEAYDPRAEPGDLSAIQAEEAAENESDEGEEQA
jgi:large subunit ribosomal protein L9